MVTKVIKGLLFKSHYSDAPEAGWVWLLQMFLDRCEDGFDGFFRGKATTSCREQDYHSGLYIFPQRFERMFFNDRICLLSCLFQSQEWPEFWPFWLRRGSEPFLEMMWCRRCCPAQPSVRYTCTEALQHPSALLHLPSEELHKQMWMKSLSTPIRI